MDVPRTSSGKPCKKCIAKGGLCHLHTSGASGRSSSTSKKLSSNTKPGSFGSALGRWSGEKKSSPKKSRKASSPISYLDKLDKPARMQVLLNMDLKELNRTCNVSRKAKEICDSKLFQQMYNAKHGRTGYLVNGRFRILDDFNITRQYNDRVSDMILEDESGNTLEIKATHPRRGSLDGEVRVVEYSLKESDVRIVLNPFENEAILFFPQELSLDYVLRLIGKKKWEKYLKEQQPAVVNGLIWYTIPDKLANKIWHLLRTHVLKVDKNLKGVVYPEPRINDD